MVELDRIRDAFAEILEGAVVQPIPLSALDGDNVITLSDRTPWYAGPTLLEHLETIEIIDWAPPKRLACAARTAPTHSDAVAAVRQALEEMLTCEPCTSLPLDPSNPRSGRWHGQKLECGIHVEVAFHRGEKTP